MKALIKVDAFERKMHPPAAKEPSSKGDVERVQLGSLNLEKDERSDELMRNGKGFTKAGYRARESTEKV